MSKITEICGNIENKSTPKTQQLSDASNSSRGLKMHKTEIHSISTNVYTHTHSWGFVVQPSQSLIDRDENISQEPRKTAGYTRSNEHRQGPVSPHESLSFSNTQVDLQKLTTRYIPGSVSWSSRLNHCLSCQYPKGVSVGVPAAPLLIRLLLMRLGKQWRDPVHGSCTHRLDRRGIPDSRLWSSTSWCPAEA